MSEYQRIYSIYIYIERERERERERETERETERERERESAFRSIQTPFTFFSFVLLQPDTTIV